MRTRIMYLFVGFFLLGTLTLFGQDTKNEKFKVYGNCGMCETRIEKATMNINGVTSADWDKETKMIEISFSAEKVKLEDIHKAIAKVGHDTEKVKADDEVYNSLPGCCKYR